ncbi:glycosyltransferase family 2 protein [Pedobacter rhodius]|uniref:Glycosyltransferase family 2 protein n=1 Tax=Pedobacter rhodius TaxID=3004098 RepID=A0ABT4KSV8_9SPHI|nr:glycosyltransferase family 2 protein [Pedobacter sp. SJ11]MCZ4221806.1 glycosyltransferase family 2 protein [Pedobacter sp. SJ11]
MIYYSCIITCYNREKLIKRAIDSILNQTDQHFEILVVDDCSTDNSIAIIEQINDKRIKLIRHSVNKGQNAALNTGVAHAKYDHLGFLDSDDIWNPEYLAEMSRIYKDNPHIKFAYCNLVNGPLWTLEGNQKYAEVLNQGFLSSMITITAKKEAVVAAGGFDLKYKICQDDDFCFRMAKLFPFKVNLLQMAMVYGDDNSMTEDRMAVAEGWAFLFRNYRKDILKFCGDNIYSKHMLAVATRFFECNNFLTGIYYYFIAIFYFLLPSKKTYSFSKKDFRVQSTNILRMYYRRFKTRSQKPSND